MTITSNYILNKNTFHSSKSFDWIRYALGIAWLVICFGFGAHLLKNGIYLHEWVRISLPLLIFMQIFVYFIGQKLISELCLEFSGYYKLISQNLSVINIASIYMPVFFEEKNTANGTRSLATTSSNYLIIA